MSPSIDSQQASRIQFAYHAYVASPIGDVFQYLLRNKAHSTHKGKRMGLAAMSAFWKPFSAQAVLGLNEQEVKQSALTSIAELQQQIELIRTTFNIPKNLNEMTKREIENMIEESLNARYIPNQECTIQTRPLPDNYNAPR